MYTLPSSCLTMACLVTQTYKHTDGRTIIYTDRHTYSDSYILWKRKHILQNKIQCFSSLNHLLFDFDSSLTTKILFPIVEFVSWIICTNSFFLDL